MVVQARQVDHFAHMRQQPVAVLVFRGDDSEEELPLGFRDPAAWSSTRTHCQRLFVRIGLRPPVERYTRGTVTASITFDQLPAFLRLL